MIHNLSHSLLEHQEVLVTGKRIAELTEETGLGLPYIDGFVGLVKANVDELNAALVKTKSFELTPQVHAADDRRDRSFKFFRGFINHKRYSDGASARQHAEYLWAFLEKHSLSLWTFGFTEQSASLDSLFNDMDGNPKAQAGLLALEAADAYAALKASQADFESLYKARAGEMASRDDPKVKSARKKLTGNLEALLINIEMAERLNQDAEGETLAKVKSLVGKVNEIIGSAMSVARARITRAASGEETEEETAV